MRFACGKVLPAHSINPSYALAIVYIKSCTYLTAVNVHDTNGIYKRDHVQYDLSQKWYSTFCRTCTFTIAVYIVLLFYSPIKLTAHRSRQTKQHSTNNTTKKPAKISYEQKQFNKWARNFLLCAVATYTRVPVQL